MPIEVLIVGQGLAGSLLAWRLLARGLRIMVIDNGATNASRVAAGLINPVTGQRLVKSHRVDELLPEALAFYRRFEQSFGEPFLVAKPMWRLLGNRKLRNLAERRCSDAAYRDYLAGIVEADPLLKADDGMLLQSQTAYLRTEALLNQIRSFLVARRAYRRCEFNYPELQIQPQLQWQDIKPRHVVFCEGYRLRQNPWFGGLPLQPAKGEILLCNSDGPMPDAILNYGYWVIPLQAGYFKTGASFANAIGTSQPTTQARNDLLDALRKHCPGLSKVTVVEQTVGIRPTTLDKQPLIGSHPRYRQLHLFNGFGAKGSLAIPYYSQRFAAALLDGMPLPNDCDLARYHDTHFPD